MNDHEPAICRPVSGTGNFRKGILSEVGGGWSHSYECPTCSRKGRFLDNLVAKGLLCDGQRFIRPHEQKLGQMLRAAVKALDNAPQ